MSSGFPDANRILIVRLGAIGDALRVSPALAELKRARPEAEIGWAVEHWVYPVLAGHPLVDRFHVLDRRALSAGPVGALGEVRRFARDLRSADYDVALDFHGRLKSGVATALSGARARIGFARGASTEMNHLFTNYHVSLEDRSMNRVSRFFRLLSGLGIEAGYDAAADGLWVDPGERRRAEAWYAEAGRPRLALYPGTSTKRAFDRWPESKWAALAGRLGAEGVRTVVFWGPDEEAMCRSIAETAGPQCSLAPRTSLTEMLAMLGLFDAFVGSNTAAMHMAWLQGVPTAVFIGDREPRTDRPLPPVPSRVLRAGSRSDGRSDGRSRRGKRDEDLVAAVSIDEAFEAVTELLAHADRRAVACKPRAWTR